MKVFREINQGNVLAVFGGFNFPGLFPKRESTPVSEILEKLQEKKIAWVERNAPSDRIALIDAAIIDCNN